MRLAGAVAKRAGYPAPVIIRNGTTGITGKPFGVGATTSGPLSWNSQPRHVGWRTDQARVGSVCSAHERDTGPRSGLPARTPGPAGATPVSGVERLPEIVGIQRSPRPHPAVVSANRELVLK